MADGFQSLPATRMRCWKRCKMNLCRRCRTALELCVCLARMIAFEKWSGNERKNRFPSANTHTYRCVHITQSVCVCGSVAAGTKRCPVHQPDKCRWFCCFVYVLFVMILSGEFHSLRYLCIRICARRYLISHSDSNRRGTITSASA